MIRLLEGGETLIVSELSRIEFYSVLSRKYREGGFDDSMYDKVHERIGADIGGRFRLVPFSTSVTSEAIDTLRTLGAELPLRALDALHLAFFAVYCGAESTFACADIRLAQAAKDTGYTVVNPATAS